MSVEASQLPLLNSILSEGQDEASHRTDLSLAEHLGSAGGGKDKAASDCMCVLEGVFMHWHCPWTPAAPIQSHLAVWHSRNGLLPAKVLGPRMALSSGRRWAWQTPEVGDLEACFLLRKEECCTPLPPMVLTLLPCTGWSAPPPLCLGPPCNRTHPPRTQSCGLLPHFLAVSRLALTLSLPMKNQTALFVL